MSFSDDIKRFKAKAEQAAANVFRGTALDIFGRIVKRTPVGKPSEWKTPGSASPGYVGGRLRANWQVEFNHIPAGVIDSTTPTGEDKKIMHAKIGDSIYIINNLEYAPAIEHGHSTKQAPAGMVRVTVREFKQIVNKNK
jgi:hypothetical protein